LGIDRQLCLDNLAIIKNNPELKAKLAKVFEFENEFEKETNPEYRLYDGFISDADKQQMNYIHSHPIADQWQLEPQFKDQRLKQLWRLYKARYFTSSLLPEDLNWWQQYRTDKLMNGLDKPNLTFTEFQLSLENNAEANQDNAEKTAILKSLYHYVQTL
jgi:exodeoxyribonuclease-1